MQTTADGEAGIAGTDSALVLSLHSNRINWSTTYPHRSKASTIFHIDFTTLLLQ
jgi:hypothetical protein